MTSVLTFRVRQLSTPPLAMPKVCSNRVLGLFLASLIVCVCVSDDDTISPLRVYFVRKHSGAGDLDAMKHWRQRGAAASNEFFRKVCTT
jgi:hypothetical protein